MTIEWTYGERCDCYQSEYAVIKQKDDGKWHLNPSARVNNPQTIPVDKYSFNSLEEAKAHVDSVEDELVAEYADPNPSLLSVFEPETE